MPPKFRRIALIGFRAVGKSTLTIQFVENQFVDSYDPTIENTFRKEFKYNDEVYTLELLDTAGQDEFSLFPQHLAMNIDGYLLVYSVTSSKSFQVLKEIYRKLDEMTGHARMPLLLVGNKTDLRHQREVSLDQGRGMAAEWKVPFQEVSATDSTKVKDIFTSILSEIEKAAGNNGAQPSKCLLM